jgi:hypothetical protein
MSLQTRSIGCSHSSSLLLSSALFDRTPFTFSYCFWV